MKKFVEAKVSDDLLKHGGMLFIANILVGLCNFLFQIFMNHGLSPSQFASLYTLLSITIIASVPGMSIQTLMAKQISHLKAKGQKEKMVCLFFHFLKRLAVLGVLILVLVLFFSSQIATFLKIDNVSPVKILGFVVALAFILPAGYGILQGLQHFMSLGLSLLIFSFSRLTLGLIFVFVFGLAVSGALASSVFGFLIAGVFIFLVLKKEFGLHIEEPISYERTDSFVWILVISFTFAFMLTFIDVILVKHFFSPGESAQYSAASLLGRTVFYFPWAISGAMFPKVSHAYAKGEATTSLLKRSLKYSFSLSLIPAICFLALPELFLKLLKAEYLESAGLLRIFAFALIPFVLLTVLIYYNLAIHNRKIVYVLGAGMFFHLLVLNMFHHSLFEIVIALGVSGLIILISTSLVTAREIREIRERH